MRHLLWILGLIAACAAAGGIARADEIVLMVEGAPSDGLVMAAVDLTALRDGAKPVRSIQTACVPWRKTGAKSPFNCCPSPTIRRPIALPERPS